MQDPKKSPKSCDLGTIAQLCRAISSHLRHLSTIGKKLLNSNVSPDVLTPHNMVNIGSLADEICWRVWGNLQISTGFTSCQGLGNVTAWHWHSSSWRQPNFVALNTGIGATYIQQGGHHVGHWPTFLVSVLFLILRPHRSTT